MSRTDGHIHVSDSDVLFGRGGKNCKHAGNQKLRAVARSYKLSYSQASKKGKSDISRAIVQYFRELQPPGRFLKKDDVSGEWVEVTDEVAREKVSQTLRDARDELLNSPEHGGPQGGYNGGPPFYGSDGYEGSYPHHYHHPPHPSSWDRGHERGVYPPPHGGGGPYGGGPPPQSGNYYDYPDSHASRGGPAGPSDAPPYPDGATTSNPYYPSQEYASGGPQHTPPPSSYHDHYRSPPERYRSTSASSDQPGAGYYSDPHKQPPQSRGGSYDDVSTPSYSGGNGFWKRKVHVMPDGRNSSSPSYAGGSADRRDKQRQGSPPQGGYQSSPYDNSYTPYTYNPPPMDGHRGSQAPGGDAPPPPNHNHPAPPDSGGNYHQSSDPYGRFSPPSTSGGGGEQDMRHHRSSVPSGGGYPPPGGPPPPPHAPHYSGPPPPHASESWGRPHQPGGGGSWGGGYHYD